MSNCKTCAHWKKAEEWSTGYGLGLGICSNIPTFWDSTEWNGEGDGRRFTNEAEGKLAFAQDSSDYQAFVLTRPEFGCVSHCAGELATGAFGAGAGGVSGAEGAAGCGGGLSGLPDKMQAEF